MFLKERTRPKQLALITRKKIKNIAFTLGFNFKYFKEKPFNN